MFFKKQGLVGLLLLCAALPAQAQQVQIPESYQGVYTGYDKGCPSYDGLLVVSKNGYTYNTARHVGDQIVTDQYICRPVKMVDDAGGIRVVFTCELRYSDSDRVDTEVATETWALGDGGGVVVDGNYVYRRCQ